MLDPRRAGPADPSITPTNARVVASVAEVPQRSVAVSIGKTSSNSTGPREWIDAANTLTHTISATCMATMTNGAGCLRIVTIAKMRAAAYKEYEATAE